MRNCEQARDLYIKGSSISGIASELDVSLQTVYSWRKSDEGTEKDWDKAKRVYLMSPVELSGIFMDSVKKMILEISEDPMKLADPKYADAITKCIAAMKKIDPMYNYMGASLDLMRVIDQYLKKTDTELAKRMQSHWPGIKEEMERFATRDGLF